MIRVAGYCRVSTDQEDQANSFASQQRYFREYIALHPDWELYEIYADEGITGTCTQKRTQFNRMIRDASDGKFHLILTKEVSRFSRNILDTISYTRALKEMGVGVRFVLDGIDTMSADAELYLAIMASLAQEESRRTSSRVVWGQTRQMEKGVVFGRSMLGYDVRGGKLTVNPDGADTVRLIFRKYALEQVSASRIAEYLTREGIPGSWTSGAVIRILKNEKYVGDLIQKKTYTPDYLTHRRRRNAGEVPMICIQNHHEAIVSRELWDLSQERLYKNNRHIGGYSGHSNRYAFSGKIKCGECGAGFVGRFRYRRDGSKLRRWSCAAAVRQGMDACSVGRILRDDDAMDMLKTALISLSFDKKRFIDTVADVVMETIGTGQREAGESIQGIQREIARIRQKREAILDSVLLEDLPEADLCGLLRRCDLRLEELNTRLQEDTLPPLSVTDGRERVVSALAGILSGETESEVFCKTVLQEITVFKDRRMVLRLNHLPHEFLFTG